MMITIIDDITHAMLNERAVLFVGDILINEVLNNKHKKIILMTCSINSVILIAKNFCSPQSAPRKTS